MPRRFPLTSVHKAPHSTCAVTTILASEFGIIMRFVLMSRVTAGTRLNRCTTPLFAHSFSAPDASSWAM